MRSSIVSDTDFRTGKTDTFEKTKAEIPTVKGICKVSVVDAKTGEVERQIVAENAYKDTLSEMAYNLAAQHFGAWGAEPSSGKNSGTQYSRGIREIHLINDQNNTEDQKYTMDEGFVEAYASFRKGYSGAAINRGNRNPNLSNTYVDNDTGELVFKYGFIFDQTRANTTFNKIALSPIDMMGQGEDTYDDSKADSVMGAGGVAWICSNGASENTMGGMGSYPLRSVLRDELTTSLSTSRYRLQEKYTKMTGSWLFWMPSNYTSRARLDFKVCNFEEIDQNGRIGNVRTITLGNIDSTLRYSEYSNIIYNSITKRFYYVSVDYDQATTPITIIEYDATNLTDGLTLPELKRNTITPPTPLYKYDGKAPSRRTYNWITPVIDWKTNKLELFYWRNVAKVTILRLDASLNIEGSAVDTDLDRPMLHGYKLSTDRYVSITAIKMGSPSYVRQPLDRPSGDTGSGGKYGQNHVQFVAHMYDTTNNRSLFLDAPEGQPHSGGYAVYAVFNNLNASFFCRTPNSGSSSSERSDWYGWLAPTTYVPPQKYLFVDTIPTVTKTNQQQIHIEYELRFPNNMKRFTDPFSKISGFPANRDVAYFERGRTSPTEYSNPYFYDLSEARRKSPNNQRGLQLVKTHRPLDPTGQEGAFNPITKALLGDIIINGKYKNLTGDRVAAFQFDDSWGKIFKTYKSNATNSGNLFSTLEAEVQPYDYWLNQHQYNSSGLYQTDYRLIVINKSTDKTLTPVFDMSPDCKSYYLKSYSGSSLISDLKDAAKDYTYTGRFYTFSSSSYDDIWLKLFTTDDVLGAGNNLDIEVQIEFRRTEDKDNYYPLCKFRLQV